MKGVFIKWSLEKKNDQFSKLQKFYFNQNVTAYSGYILLKCFQWIPANIEFQNVPNIMLSLNVIGCEKCLETVQVSFPKR